MPGRAPQPAGTGRPGRPRSAEAGSSILAAAIAILAEKGLAGMSIEQVAARAGVAKTTIYRRWPSRGALALDAFMAEFAQHLAPPHTGSVREDLVSALRTWSRAVTQTRAGRMLAGLLAEAQRDDKLAVAWRERVFEPLRRQHRAIIKEAVARGELPEGTDADLVLDLLFGAAYHRLLHGHLQLTDRFARKAVDIVLDGLAGERGAGAPARP